MEKLQALGSQPLTGLIKLFDDVQFEKKRNGSLHTIEYLEGPFKSLETQHKPVHFLQSGPKDRSYIREPATTIVTTHIFL